LRVVKVMSRRELTAMTAPPASAVIRGTVP
jgi:hypothetical protein